MKEIKFRTYDLKGKRWHYWGIFVSKNMAYFIPPILSNMDSYQYTGKKDNNGKELYEKDILNVTTPNGIKVRAVIDWYNFGWRYKALFLLNDTSDLQLSEDDIYPYYSNLHYVGFKFEKIGTVYENPELLEGK